MPIKKHFCLFMRQNANSPFKNINNVSNEKVTPKNDWKIFVNDFRTIYLRNGRAFQVGSKIWSFDGEKSPYNTVYNPVEIKLPNHRPIVNIKTGGGNTFLQDDQGKWFGFGFIFQQNYWSKHVPIISKIHAIPPIQGHQVIDVVPEFNVFYKTNDDKWYAQGSNYARDLGMVKGQYQKWLPGASELPDPQEITLPWQKKIKRIENGHGNNFFYDGKDWYCSGDGLHAKLHKHFLTRGVPFKISLPGNIQIKNMTSTDNIAVAEDQKGNFYISMNNLYHDRKAERINSHFTKLTLPNHEPIKKVYAAKDGIIILSELGHCYQIGRIHIRSNDFGDVFGDCLAHNRPGLNAIELPEDKKVSEVYLSTYHAILQTTDGKLFSLGSDLSGVRRSAQDVSIAIPLDSVIKKLNNLVNENTQTVAEDRNIGDEIEQSYPSASVSFSP